MKTEQEIFDLNLNFKILRDLIHHNGLEKPICGKHAIKWLYKTSDYAFENMMYVLSQQPHDNVEVQS